MAKEDTSTNAFNYGDTEAVVKLTKRVMTEAGYYNGDIDNPEWGDKESSSWAGYCDRYGGNYTPFPEIWAQPEHIKESFGSFEGEVESQEITGVRYTKPSNAQDMLLQQPPEGEAKPRPSDPANVNFAATQGTNLDSDNLDANPPDAPQQDNIRSFVMNREVVTTSTDTPKLPDQEIYHPPEDNPDAANTSPQRSRRGPPPPSPDSNSTDNTPPTDNPPPTDDPMLKVR